MHWDSIAENIPGKSALSCEGLYRSYFYSNSDSDLTFWDEERKNELARLYRRYSAEMWAKIATEMSLSWNDVELMHWKLGYIGMMTRGSIPRTFEPSSGEYLTSKPAPQSTIESTSELPPWCVDLDGFDLNSYKSFTDPFPLRTNGLDKGLDSGLPDSEYLDIWSPDRATAGLALRLSDEAPALDPDWEAVIDMPPTDTTSGAFPGQQTQADHIPTSSDATGEYPPPRGNSPSSVYVAKRVFKLPRNRTKRGRKKHRIEAVDLLSAWLDQHREYPYPTAGEKAQLVKDTGLTETQVLRWFTNTRARRHLSPLEAWLGSSSEHEATHEDIERAAESLRHFVPTRYEENTPPASAIHDAWSDLNFGSAQVDALTQPAAPDPQPNPLAAVIDISNAHPTQKELTQDIQDSTEQSVLVLGQDQSANTSPVIPALPSSTLDVSMPNLTDEIVTQQITPAPIKPSSSRKTPYPIVFQCTFCRKQLTEKSWKRHEECTHLPRQTWTCLLTGPSIPLSNPSSASICAFCNELNPDSEHAAVHSRVDECQARAPEDRAFVRKDGLAQHIKLFHGARLREDVAAEWSSKVLRQDQVWTCGFCGARLEGWAARAVHISQHFRNGASMDQWRFEPESGAEDGT
ncbi:hypothetical protein AOQ84DRAFT_363655 [Glonium stellatum]|uniref:Homeobox domain-containing protein n=1 Tax=Glonium stellatum TaxID=574774 RepID=A0A8E2F1S0_9PEZI|nr:hypothetical protein AOQ84DRAFT_363655 [Glonium stellatum]